MNRVLHIVGTMNRGGAETFIMNLYRHINRTETQFDFIVHSEIAGDYDEEIRRLGGKIHIISPKSDGVFKSLISLMKVIKDNQYKVVHRHGSNCTILLDLFIAKLAGAKVLVAHSHNSTNSSNQKLHFLLRKILNFKSFIKVACSEGAGKWMYDKKEFYILKNCIDTEKFSFDLFKRNIMREKLGIDNQLVIGHVGRLTKVKNHEFLLNVFKEFLVFEPNSILLIVGEGELKSHLKSITKQLAIENNVIFLGVREDIDELMQGMDVLVFPSLYEGLPLTLIEAQTSGLKCLVSSNITSEVKITDELFFKDLEDSYIDWAKSILALVKENSRNTNKKKIEMSGYSIDKT
ncbi:glycosyltransferase, partial [Turicibacter sanguinis]|nr:glycosyltransferase [Turicibacter sanguinis]